MENFVVNLERRPPGEEDYQQAGENIVQIRVQLPSGEMVCDPKHRVELKFSRAAMLGFGSELIRAAHRPDTQELFWHLRPAEKDFASEGLGIFIHPKSCELLISVSEHGPIESLT